MTDGGDDKLSHDVAIAASLEENGIKLKATSRAVAALDRLGGAILDFPTAYIEGATSKKRLNDQIDAQLKRAQAALAEAQIASNPALGGVLIDSVLIDRARKQKNLAGVAVETIEAMKALPPPATGEQQPDENATGPTADGNVDDDWMNMFLRYAEDASSDQLQQIWGRVLAGEVRKTGSYSRQTLRFIAELDGETARNCEWITSYVLGFDWVPKGDDWNRGENLLRLIDLQRMGVIEGAGGMGPSRTFTFREEDGSAMLFQGSKAILMWGKPGKEVSQSALLITRLGKEVFSLLPTDPNGKGLRRVARFLEQDKDIYKAAIGDVVPIGGDRWQMPNPENLWDKQQKNEA